MQILLKSTKRFVKDYRLPLEATLLFILTVLVMLFARNFDRLALADVLGNKTGAGSDYAKLFSNDKVDDLKKNEVGIQENGNEKSTGAIASAAPAVTTPFTISPNPPPPNVPPPPGSPPGPTPIFSASIQGLVFEGSYMECAGIGENNQECSKRYVFRAGVRAENGPGTIAYSWESTVAEAQENGGFSVGSGETFTPLRKDIKLPCSQPRMFSLQLVLSQPNTAESNILQQHHSCDMTTPPPIGP